jgi:hypothetical protein
MSPNDLSPADLHMPRGPLLQRRAAARETAETVADELARLGYSAPEILRSFNDASFGAAYGAFRALGESVVRAIIVRAVIRWPDVGGVGVSAAGR